MDAKLWRSRFQEYMEGLNWSGRTIESYGAELSRFLRFLTEHGVPTVSDINRDLIESYRGYLFALTYRGKRLGVNSQVSRMNAVKAFLRFLVREQYLLTDPAAEVSLPQLRRKLPRVVLTEAQVERLLEAPDITDTLGVRDRAMLELLYSSGIRNTELGMLTVGDVDLEQGDVWVMDGKGGTMDKVPLGEEAALWVGIYLRHARPYLLRNPEDAWLFLSWRGRQLDREMVTEVVARAGQRAGLPERVTPHTLRHCCATHMLARGAGLRHVQQLLRHKNISTTVRYTYVEISDLREVHRRFHPRERGPQQ